MLPVVKVEGQSRAGDYRTPGVKRYAMVGTWVGVLKQKGPGAFVQGLVSKPTTLPQ